MKRIVCFFIALSVLVSLCACGHGITDFDITVDSLSEMSPIETIPKTDPPKIETFSLKMSFAGDVLLASFKDEKTRNSGGWGILHLASEGILQTKGRPEEDF